MPFLCALAISVSALATTLNPVQLLNPAGSTSGQAIVSTGASTAPAWANVAATALAAQAANTVVANVTGSSASPTAFAMPSCSTSASALNWTSGTGFTCNSSVNAATLGGATFAAPGAIGSTTASTGKFTTLQATGAITPSSTSGIVGTTTNDNAISGSIGEFPTPSNLSSVSLTTGVAANVSSISLSAGDWDVSCNTAYAPAGTTTINGYATGISTTSATFAGPGTYTSIIGASFTGSTGSPAITTPTIRESLSATTTIYCVASMTFGTSTATASGFLRARRIR